LAGAEFRIWPDKELEGAPFLEEVTTFLSRGRQSAKGDSDHYLIKTQHVQQSIYVKSQITLAPEVANKVHPDAVVRLEDVLIACSAAGCLGRVARFIETDQLASTDTHVAIARANSQVILPEYLYAYLRGAQGQIQLRSRERGDWTREKVGFRLTELNLADLKRVPVPLPPLHEQRRIVSSLDNLQSKVDSLRQLQSETSAELDALLPSILDKAFKGEL
jgi:type I restriction enzyme, S subunit